MKKTISFKGTPVTIEDKLNVGEVFPNFRAVTKTLSEFELAYYKGKKIIVNTFPSVDTGVCALQLTRFNQEAANFDKDVQLLTISADLPFALGRYCADKGIGNALTASDHKELDFGLKYGFVIKELRLLTRGTVIVDKEGTVQYVEYVPEVATEPDYSKALEVIKTLI